MKRTPHHIMVKLHIPVHIAWVVLLFFLASEAFAQTPAPNTSSRSDNNLHQTHDNRPQWQDVGLKDILMVEGQSTVTAPNPAVSWTPYSTTVVPFMPYRQKAQQGFLYISGIFSDSDSVFHPIVTTYIGVVCLLPADSNTVD